MKEVLFMLLSDKKMTIKRGSIAVTHFDKCQKGFHGVIAAIALLSLFALNAEAQSSQIVRIGFSSSMFGEVNQNDAIAAVRVWALAFVEARDISAVPQPLVLNGMDEIRKALDTNTLDYVNLTTNEYFTVRELVPGDSVTLGAVSGSITEEYLLIVSENSKFDSLNDLRGQSLRMLSSARASMATVWLDTILCRAGLGTAGGFFGAIEPNTKVGKNLLPVFFGQADACVVTRSGFDIMTELNPQIGQRLKVIAASPPLVPTVFCFTLHVDPSLKEKVSREITQWHLTPAGKQCLTIFQTDSIEEHPVERLEETLGLIAEHKRLLGR